MVASSFKATVDAVDEPPLLFCLLWVIVQFVIVCELVFEKVEVVIAAVVFVKLPTTKLLLKCKVPTSPIRMALPEVCDIFPAKTLFEIFTIAL